MAQVEIYSLVTPTNVLVGPERFFTVDRGEAVLFDAESTAPPVIVDPTPPGGTVILLAPEELASRSAAELAERATRIPEGLLLGVRDVGSIDLQTVLGLAEHAAQEGGRLVLHIGDA